MVLSRLERISLLNYRCVESCQRVDSESQEGLPTDKNEAIAKLDEWYEAGVPFFTREAIRDLNQQIKGLFTPDQKILVKGLDGVSVEFDVTTGQTFTAADGQIMSRVLFTDKETEEPILPRMKSLEKVRDHFQKRLQQWKTKKAFRKLESILSNAAAKHKIDKVIAIACGSMASDELPGYRNSPYDQLAQDPVYTEIDKSILNENGIQVIKDPQAWLEVDDSSVVLSFYPNIPVRDILADLARPAVLICNRLEADEEMFEVDEDSEDERPYPESSRVLAMFEEYETFEFWDKRANLSNRDIVAYVRK